MIIPKTVAVGFLLSSCALSFGQTADSIKVKITGKWVLVKETIMENNQTKDILTLDTKHTFEFNNDGTYTETSINKFGKCISVGKWRIAVDRKSIETYSNRFLPPCDHTGTIQNNDADHPLVIIKLTKGEFVTNEYYGEAQVATSYYKKQ